MSCYPVRRTPATLQLLAIMMIKAAVVVAVLSAAVVAVVVAVVANALVLRSSHIGYAMVTLACS